jgi:hypothetical protein
MEDALATNQLEEILEIRIVRKKWKKTALEH